MHIPATRTPLAASLALALGTVAASPALAKETKISLPASTLKDASTKVCMPRKVSQTVGKDKTQPATLCNTVGEWAAHGVIITPK